MRGRTPAGVHYVDQLPGSGEAKERLKALLDVMSGACRLFEACDRLDLCPQRLHQLREDWLTRSVQMLEPQKAGRKPHVPSPEHERIRQLEQQVADLELELRATRAREEIALILPPAQTPAAEKKNAPAWPATAATHPEATSAGLSAWDEEEHVKRLHELSTSAPTRAASRSARRGPARQLPQRQREQLLRRHLVHFLDAAAAQGWSVRHSAQRLHLCPRTLRHWRRAGRAARPGSWSCRGRPTQRAPRALRQQVLALLEEVGPGLGVPALRAAFPTMARAELTDLLRRYRRVWRRRHQQAWHVLHWQQPGSVWAMDFTETTSLVEGGQRYLLAVRDLASGQQLLWQPVAAPNTAETVAALRSLFARHGAPLVLKTDNGSPFCAEATLDFLHHAGVESLFSPPGTPRYNGAVEAGIGSLKTRSERHACHRGRPGAWTWDDLAAAQAEANSQARPHGPHGPAPDHAWNARRALTPEQRARFQATVAQERQALLTQDGPPDHPAQQRAHDRHAIRRALVEHGLLLFSRRLVPLTIQRPKTAKIS